MRDALFVGSADGKLLQKSPRLNHGLIGMVGGEHDPLHAAEFKQQVKECRREIEAAERVMDVFTQIGADRALKFGYLPGHNVHPLEHEGQPFAHVADYDLQFGKAVEYAAEDEANDVNRSFMCQPQPGPASICVTSGAKPLYDASMTGFGGGVGWR